MTRIHRTIALAILATFAFGAGSVVAASKEEDQLFSGCDWLERAIAREPDREDAFGMFMRGMRPKCTAMLEGIARKDNSVRADAVRQIVKEIAELQSVIDAEHGGPPPVTTGPSPGDAARQKIADEKAAADKIAADKAAQERAEKEKQAADKKAAEDAKKAAEDAKKAEEEAKKASERDNKQKTDAEKRAEEEAKKAAAREERERVAAEKKAEEEAKKIAAREERERVAAEKKAAEEQKKADEEARKAAEREEKERVAREREEARKKAQELVDAETDSEKKAAIEEREAREAREREAREAAEREALERQAKRDSPPVKPGKAPKGVDGTWEQPEAKVLDRHVKRTLNLISKDKKIQGELYEEVWFPAPSTWIDASCGGNATFRMVTTARVTGEVDGKNVVLSRDPPRILTCTCSSRCTVEARRRGMDLAIAASGAELKDQTGVFVRPGTQIVTNPEEGEPKQVLAPADFAGNWETAPFKSRDRTLVQRLEITIDGDGRITGLFVERSTQGLPLASWSDRFCGGASKWDWVTQWKITGKVSGRKAGLTGREGDNLLCSCPSKCTAPKDKISLDLVYGATGATLHVGDQVFERR